jgi:hypothetical protein
MLETKYVRLIAKNINPITVLNISSLHEVQWDKSPTTFQILFKKIKAIFFCPVHSSVNVYFCVKSAYVRYVPVNLVSKPILIL